HASPSRRGAHEERERTGERRDLSRHPLRLSAVTAHAVEHVVLCGARTQRDAEQARSERDGERRETRQHVQDPAEARLLRCSRAAAPSSGCARSAANSSAASGLMSVAACARSNTTKFTVAASVASSRRAKSGIWALKCAWPTVMSPNMP